MVATFTDSDTQGPPNENFGPNGCTYDPVSNTGALIVRKLVNTSSTFIGSLIATGIMP